MGAIVAYSIVAGVVGILVALYVSLYRTYQGVLKDERKQNKWMQENDPDFADPAGRR